MLLLLLCPSPARYLLRYGLQLHADAAAAAAAATVTAALLRRRHHRTPVAGLDGAIPHLLPVLCQRLGPPPPGRLYERLHWDGRQRAGIQHEEPDFVPETRQETGHYGRSCPRGGGYTVRDRANQPGVARPGQAQGAR